jgi:sugar phosphate isomerase/epimerase
MSETMRLGYNTNGFAHHALDDVLAILAELDYRGVAITMDHLHLNPYVAALRHQQQLAEVAARCRDLDLLPVIETGARFLLDPRRKHRPTLLSAVASERARRVEFLARASDAAAALGAPVVSFWSGAPDGPEPVETLDDRLAAELAPLCRRAADAGVVLALEPEPGMHVDDLAGYQRIRAHVDHPSLRLTLDVGHAHLTEPDGAAASIRRVAADIVNVHLEGMRKGVHDHLRPHEGDLDLAACVAAFAEIGYRGPANLELSRHSHAAVETAREARAFFRRLGV